MSETYKITRIRKLLERVVGALFVIFSRWKLKKFLINIIHSLSERIQILGFSHSLVLYFFILLCNFRIFHDTYSLF